MLMGVVRLLIELTLGTLNLETQSVLKAHTRQVC